MSEFYGERVAPELGDPRTDPPMVVRVHPDDDPRDPAARRAVATDVGHVWFWVTGRPTGRPETLIAHQLADWPVTHPIVYCTAHRHAAHAASTPALELDGSDAEGAAPFKDARPAR